MSSAVGVSLPRLSRSTTTTREILKYAVDGKVPGFTADFIDNYYSGHTSLSSAITHSRSGNAVMTDGYGPELVTNGGFDSDSDWTKGSGWSISGGSAHRSNAGATSGLAQTIAPTADVVYEISYYLQIDSGNVATQFIGGTNVAATAHTTSGYKRDYIKANTGNTQVRLWASSTFAGSIDNVSVRAMPVLKWAPHNLLTYSAFDSATPTNWSVGFGTGTYNHTLGSEISNLPTITQEQTASGRSYLTQNITLKANATYTLKVLVDESLSSITDGNNKILSANISGASGTLSASIDDVSDGKVEITFTTGSTTSGTVRVGIGVLNNAVGTVVFAAPHLYRSDLGGMADNPDQPLSRASYVPTASSAVYLPRVGHHVYNGSAWVNEGLLAESEARTNLETYSDILDAQWVNTQSATVENQAVSPSGLEDATFIRESTGTGTHRVSANFIPVSGTTYTFSVYAKKKERSIFSIGGAGLYAYNEFPEFDLDNGIAYNGGTGNATVNIQDVGNDWFRCSVTFTATGTSVFILQLHDSLVNSTPPSSSGKSYTGDGTSGMYFWGAQTEATSSPPSSLIPTSGSSVTRASESFTIPSANLPWPEPRYTGPELVTNGTFDSTDISDWVIASASATVAHDTGGDGGRIAVTTTGSAGNGRAGQNMGELTAGKAYRVSVDFDKGTANAVYLRIAQNAAGGTTVKQVIGSGTSGTIEYTFVPASTADYYVVLVGGNTAGHVAYFDNVTFREIDPLSVSIAMDGRVSYADTNNSNEVRFFEWLEDGSNYLASQIRTDSTRTGAIYVAYNNGGTFDSVSSGATYYSPDILVPYNQAVRITSTALNYAADGVSGTANTTLTGLVDLSDDDFTLAKKLMGTIGTFRVWDRDLGDDGIVEATNPSLEPSLSLTFEGTGTNSFVVNNWSE